MVGFALSSPTFSATGAERVGHTQLIEGHTQLRRALPHLLTLKSLRSNG
jgi:hypothetical protein